MTHGLTHSRMMSWIGSRNEGTHLTRHRLIITAFKKGLSAGYVAIDVFKARRTVEGELVGTYADHGAMLLVNLVDGMDVSTTQPCSHCPDLWHTSN